MPNGGPGGVLSLHMGDGRIGWCYGSTELGLWILPKTDDHGCIGAAVIDELRDLCKVMQPRVIVVSGSQGDIESVRPDVAVLHIGLLMLVRLISYRRKIPLEVPNIQEVRAKVLGRSDFPRANGLKSAVMSLARRRGLNTIEVDQAHALMLWSYRSELEEVAK
jgi:hypothetical protein